MKNISYDFILVTECNMCKSSSENFRLLGRRLNTSQGLRPRNKVGITTTIFQCKKCGLIFPNPLPVPVRLEDHYGIEPEKYWTEDFIASEKGKYDYVIGKAKKYAGENGKVLDVGSGLGNVLKTMLDANIDAYGLEPSGSFYNYAIKKNSIPAHRLRMQKLEDTDYPDSSFDYITLGAVLEHLYDPSACLKRAVELLKPGGFIEIEVPSSKWLVNKLVNAFYKITATGFVGNISPMHTPYHLYEFNLKSFQLNGLINNYKVFHHYYFVAITYLPAILEKPLRWFMKKTNTGMQLIVVLKKNS